MTQRRHFVRDLRGFCASSERPSRRAYSANSSRRSCTAPRPVCAKRRAGAFSCCDADGRDRLAKDARRTKETQEGELRGAGHHRPRGPRGGAQAPRHVHRLDRRPRPPSPDLRGHGQLGRRGARGRVRPRRDRDPPRQLGHGDGQRARHPGRDAREGEAPGRRGRAHRAARRRQVRRRRRLQGLRRPARRRRLRRQRAVREARADHLARGSRVDPVLRARRAAGRAEEGRRPPTGAARASPSCPTSRSSRRSTTSAPRSSSASARWPSSPRACEIDFVDERGEGFETSFQYDGGIVDFVKYLHSQGTREPSCTRRSSTWRTRATSARSRSRCSGTTPTRRACSRSPTTSTRTRAARTCPASARRSRARSTPTRARRAS